MNVEALCCFLCTTLFYSANALMFHLPPNSEKCLKEEIHKNVLVTGDYHISEGFGQKTHLSVTDFECTLLTNNTVKHCLLIPFKGL